MKAVFDKLPPISSTKPITGHTLGAAGALEAAICWMVLTEKRGLPVHCWDGVKDEEISGYENHVFPTKGNGQIAPSICMSNSFAFGGCNVSLILGGRQ
jgi:3-oxoacyl-[acyl-carrier-protein] synthase-1